MKPAETQIPLFSLITSIKETRFILKGRVGVRLHTDMHTFVAASDTE